MNLLQGHDATCPHCWETVCCKPMLVAYSAIDGQVDALSVDAAD
jgi:hypothetical protein